MILGSPLRQGLKLGKVATDESQLFCPAPSFKLSFGCYGVRYLLEPLRKDQYDRAP
jgi:hypothetical protein